MPPRKIDPSVRVGVWVKVRVNFRVGGAARQLHPRKIAPRLGFGFGLGLVLGLGQFSSGAIVLELIIRYDVL